MKELVGTSSILNILHRYDVRFDRASSARFRS